MFLEGVITMKSVVSYPTRGVGGNASYRGNCSPGIVQDLIDFYKMDHISDYMVGGGTTKDVAIQNNIPHFTTDLHSGFNMLTDEIKERNPFIFWHPPYHDIIQYSDKMYSAESVRNHYGYNPNDFDLSQCSSWEDFIKKLNYCMVKQFQSLEAGGRLAVLMGDIKKKGRLYSMLLDICKPGKIESIVIKMQHNCMSDNKTYASYNFIPIVHEYLLIVQKEIGPIYDIKLSRDYHSDMRDEIKSTWKDVLMAVLSSYSSPVSLNCLYSVMEGHKKTSNNRFWKEKIRQTLHGHSSIFVQDEKGLWSLAA